ncbi:hypothetical protein J5Y09_06185 [Roseomonas sp. PWR1]|uniref:Uncharacterized protein n=1 Tax=Roseomonas nitratireducens TaxID=2820810 RepID=A0ABS4AQ63_9PROT|nr:hypothetical protein [Neoroseomonas nitratireducens]MBP0463491.1 hypothetical protein [Neoroseomonas nitratireducens]
MNGPRRPRLPSHVPDAPPPDRPDPRLRPDERKEGGPDYGKEIHQRDKARRDHEDAVNEAEKEPRAE